MGTVSAAFVRRGLNSGQIHRSNRAMGSPRSFEGMANAKGGVERLKSAERPTPVRSMSAFEVVGVA